MTKTRKIILGFLLILVGLPLLVVLTSLACFWIMDRTNGTIISSGLHRRYLLYIPKTYDRTKPAPLVISIHPAATWPAVEQNISRWNDLADQHGFIVVYPEGTGAFFGGLGPGPQIWPMGPHTLVRDVTFISDLIAKLKSQYSIDSNRIYADGMSNGGGMAFALSCKLPNQIAAVGAVAAAQNLEWEQCQDLKPVPIIAFHGTADKAAPYNGGRSPIAPRLFPNLPDWTAHVARKNHCGADPIETRISPSVRRLAYNNCANNADVVLYTIEDGGHTWPGGKHLPERLVGHTIDDISATALMWDFFTHHPLTLN